MLFPQVARGAPLGTVEAIQYLEVSNSVPAQFLNISLLRCIMSLTVGLYHFILVVSQRNNKILYYLGDLLGHPSQHVLWK